MKKKLILLLTMLMILLLSFYMVIHKDNTKVIKNNTDIENNNLISVLVDGVEQSAFPSKGSAEYQNTSCTNGETAVWDEANWKLSIQDISASTRCVVSFVTGGHNVYVTVSGGTVDTAPKNVPHNGNVTFNVASSNSNYVFSSVKCSGANSYTWANNILSVNGVTADTHCEVVFSRPTYTVYFNVVGGYTADNYLTVVRGGGNSTTFGAVPGYLTGGSRITCDPGITGKITGTRVVLSEVQTSGDCTITCARDTSSYLPGGVEYKPGQEVSYANLAWLVVTSDNDTVTLILQTNATYSGNTTGTGIFGSGVTFTSSSARSYLQDIWLQQDAQKYLRTAIDSEGLAYQENANGYVRLPYISEVSRSIPNASKTSFWTMDNDGDNHVYYGQPDGYGKEGLSSIDGKYYYEFYTLATSTSVTYTRTGTTSQYYSTTCASNWTNENNSSYNYHCSSTGSKGFSISSDTYMNGIACSKESKGTWEGGGPSGCSGSNESTCAKRSATVTGTTNPYSGHPYNVGAYSNGYRKWSGNVAGAGVTSQTATLSTDLTYSNSTTNGNSGMNTGVQAVSPNENSGRLNDTIPSTSSISLGSILSNSNWGTYYQGYSTSSCDSIKKTSITDAQAGFNSTYTRYTLEPYNTADIGYRPVIVVYKAN